MFGHRKGAFTGADRDKIGLLEVANSGTFFLDELTEMPLALQAKLLRVIQDGVVRRVGSEQHDAVVDVRFVSATNRDPREAIKSKHPSRGLYYRLNVVRITLPPLRDRAEDIPILANHFLVQFWNRHHSSRDSLPRLGSSALDFLMSRPWRGNVRELQNVIEHLVVLAEPDSEIGIDNLPMDQEWARGDGNGRIVFVGVAVAARQRVPPGEGARAGEFRRGVRDAARRARIGQRVPGCATGERRSNDSLSTASAPWLPSRRWRRVACMMHDVGLVGVSISSHQRASARSLLVRHPSGQSAPERD